MSEVWVFDSEVYRNFNLIAFRPLAGGESVKFERSDWNNYDGRSLADFIASKVIVGFNSQNFDAPILIGAGMNRSASELKDIANAIIEDRQLPWDIRENFGIPNVPLPHIDIMQISPVSAQRLSLKLYGARIHAPTIQDLPIPPNKTLSAEESQTLIEYCDNDLDITARLTDLFSERIAHRASLSRKYDIDLMSKSDAQIAEAVIKRLFFKKTGRYPTKSKVSSQSFHWAAPEYVQFKTEYLRGFFERVCSEEFVTNDAGELENNGIVGAKLQIGHSIYTFGKGGLHSNEKGVAYRANDKYALIDRDVASFYPALIINQQLCPQALGSVFMDIYTTLRDQRLADKQAGRKTEAEGGKITINGGFGKFGSPFSILYGPRLLIQTTVTGQLLLLMLIEALELAGFSVISANTDGIVTVVERARKPEFEQIIGQWERACSLVTEETEYSGVYSANVNTYYAETPGGKSKTKGVLSNPWKNGGLDMVRYTPAASIAAEAALNLILHGKPIDETLRESTSVSDFVFATNVAKGAIFDGKYLGRVARWYWAEGRYDPIMAVGENRRVPQSEGAALAMTLPETLPKDIDYRRYKALAERWVTWLGCRREPVPRALTGMFTPRNDTLRGVRVG